VPLAPFTTQCLSETSLAQSTAREKLRAVLGDKSAWLVNIAEGKQSINMIATRGRQIFDLANLLRRRQWRLALKHLEASGVPVSSKRYKHAYARSFADAFLEFHFGWEPLIKDIYNSIDVLQRPFPYGTIEAKGKRINIDSSFSSITNDSYKIQRILGNCKGYVRTYCGADITVTNPNLWLANNLGFVNPATVAWELVPFSFVVDWFSTVGSFLEQYTDTLGLSLTQAWSTTKCELTGTTTNDYVPKPGNSLPAWSINTTCVGNYIDRSLSIPGISLGRRQVTELSATRAITSISLLIQKGLKQRPN